MNMRTYRSGIFPQYADIVDLKFIRLPLPL
jgi:hypothetical protein